MTYCKRVLSCLLIVLLLPVTAIGVGASSEAAAFAERLLNMQEKYNIDILYEVEADGSPVIGTGNLATLDGALNNVTAGVISQVSDYYLQRNGSRLAYRFLYSPYRQSGSIVEILGHFDKDSSVIDIYLPESSRGTFTTGSSPITFVHEFGHAFQVMFEELYGVDRMRQEWVSLNGGTSYNEGYISAAYNKIVFMSGYGASSYTEDFAEVFGHAFVRNQQGQGFYHRLMTGNKLTPLGRKINYIASILPIYLSGTETAVGNLNRIYSTSIFINYQGIRLSGEDLQFMGYSAPRYVLRGILSVYRIEEDTTVWIREIGGWQVKARTGRYYLVFPGGPCSELARPLVAT